MHHFDKKLAVSAGEDQMKTRRTFLEDLACKVAGIGLVAMLPTKTVLPAQDGKPEVVATVKISENKDLEKIGGFVLVKDTPEGDIIVVRSAAEQFSALSNVCPHKQCRVEVKSSTLIQCPCHQSAYKIDGTYISGPANASLRKFEVRAEGDLITVTRS